MSCTASNITPSAISSKKKFFNGIPSICIDNLNFKKSEKDLLCAISKIVSQAKKENTPLEGLIKKNDVVLLVTPIDSEAPKGRLILPQMETIRDALDKHAVCIVVQVDELSSTYNSLTKKPALVITDSQAFTSVARVLPKEQKLTSFSILFARKKGGFEIFTKNVSLLKILPKNARVLVIETCSHHKTCNDIGTVRIPMLYKKNISSNARFFFAHEIPTNIKDYDLVLHCGACMITKNAMNERLKKIQEGGVPVINYGFFIAYCEGVFPRAIKAIKENTEN